MIKRLKMNQSKSDNHECFLSFSVTPPGVKGTVLLTLFVFYLLLSREPSPCHFSLSSFSR